MEAKMKKEYIKYETFLEKCNLIALSKQKKVKEKYDEAVIKTSNIIDEITDLPNETKTWIVNSIYENRKTVGLAGRLTEELGVSKETAEKIYESIDKKLKKKVFQHYGKVPQGGWNGEHKDYNGFDDENYGTAFQCHYIEQLGLFFVVIDIDAHNPDTDIPIDTMESCIPEEYRDTRVINTPSGGKHYYYLSFKMNKIYI